MKKPIWNDKTARYEIDGIDFDGHFIEWKLIKKGSFVRYFFCDTLSYCQL